MTLRFVLLICILLAAFPCFGAAGAEDASPSTPADLIYITEDFPPYNYLDAGRLTGYTVDVLALMWREMGVDPQPITVLPWERGMQELRTRPNVVLFNAVKSADRARLYKFVTPTNFTLLGVVAPMASGISISSVSDLLSYRVGSLAGDISEEAVLAAGFPMERLHRVNTMPMNAQNLIHGRVDMVVCDPESFMDMLHGLGEDPDDYEVIVELGQGECGFMFSADIPDDLVRQFQDALDAVRDSQEFILLGKKYLGL